jgi:hypothetical protein
MWNCSVVLNPAQDQLSLLTHHNNTLQSSPLNTWLTRQVSRLIYVVMQRLFRETMGQ